MNARDAKLADLLDAVLPRRERGATEPSAGRLYIRDNFDTISAARDRGLTWPQIARVIASAGVRSTDGTEIEWRALKGLFHAERYAKGEKRKRRTKAKPAQLLTQNPPTTRTAPAPAPAPVKPVPHEIVEDDPDDDQPEPEFGPVTGYRIYKPKE